MTQGRQVRTQWHSDVYKKLEGDDGISHVDT